MTRRIAIVLLAVLAGGLMAASTAGAAPGFCYPEYGAQNLTAVSPAPEVTPPGGTLEVSGHFNTSPEIPWYGPLPEWRSVQVILFTGATIVGRAPEMKLEEGVINERHVLKFRHVFLGLTPGSTVEAFQRSLVFNGYAEFSFPSGGSFQGCSQQSGPANAVIAGNGAAPLARSKVR